MPVQRGHDDQQYVGATRYDAVPQHDRPVPARGHRDTRRGLRRAKACYLSLGWRFNGEVNLHGGYRLAAHAARVHASISFGTQAAAAQPGIFDGLIRVVGHIDAVRSDLIARARSPRKPTAP